MATRDTTTIASSDRTSDGGIISRAGTRKKDETKPSFMTTELYAFVASVVAILVAAAQADNFDAPRAWTLVAAVAIGYMVSRGLAKSGSSHREHGDDRT